MAALLLVVEVVVRLVAPQPLDPGISLVIENDIAGLQPKIEFEIDANKIRGFNSSKAKPEGTVRILCVGGSATSTMLQGAGDTWWGALGASLEKSVGRPVQVGCLITSRAEDIIGGAQWADHILETVDGIDLVIAMYGHREVLSPDMEFSFDPESVEQIQFGGGGSFMRGVAKSSHLVRVVRNWHVRSKRAKRPNQVSEPNFIRDRLTAAGVGYRSLTATTSRPPRQSDPIAAYLHGLGMFIEATQSHGVGLLVVGEPTVFDSAIPSQDAAETLTTAVRVGPGERDFARPMPDWVHHELGRYYTAGKQLCDGAAVEFINLHGVILPSRENFVGEALLTDHGAQTVANQLLPAARRRLQ